MGFNVAVVGSGPAGFYVTEALLQSDVPIRVDMIERLPVPFGLVRYGVAPDHQKLKAVTAVFERIANDENFTFLGNVEVGRDVEVAQLREAYDAVVLATGALSDRPLGIQGENLPGSEAATEIVAWYNGHPDFQNRTFDLSHPNVVVIGNGNVALDVCRILAKDIDELKRSDISENALEALAASQITDIFLVGRRGPAQAKFTSKELREFGEFRHAQAVVDREELDLNATSIEELESPQGESASRNVELLRSFSAREGRASPKPKRVHFRFLLAPMRVVGRERVEGIDFQKVALTGPAFNQSVKPTGAKVRLPAGLLIRSVGYMGTPIAGVPFDYATATIPHTDGRVSISGGMIASGLYVAGWIKRGPSGVIGTNRACGVETSQAILADLQSMDRSSSAQTPDRREQLLRALAHAPRKIVDFAGWRRIDALERAAGAVREKPREKITSIRAMLEASEDRALSSSVS
jgi:ferredoxin--NADP+ reductase